MMIATWYVLEDGSVADPSEVKADAAGVLRHSDGRAVGMRGAVPRTRSVDVSAHREMRPQPQSAGYVTCDGVGAGGGGGGSGQSKFDHDGDGQPGGSSKPADPAGDLAALRAEYNRVFGKRPFPGWDAAALREKIAASSQEPAE